MRYFIELNYLKEDYFLRKRDWERNGERRPKPFLTVRSEKELEPLSFEDGIDFYVKFKY